MVSLEKVDDAIIYELQIQRGEPEPLRLISHDISTERRRRALGYHITLRE